MSEKNLESIDIAQNGKGLVNTVPTQLSAEAPMLDRMYMESAFGGYKAPADPAPLPTYASPDNVYPDPTILAPVRADDNRSDLKSLENFLLTPGKVKDGGSVMRTLAEVSSNRYDNFVPGDYNNEDAYAQGQGWPSKMVNGVGKGLLLTGTTFLQGTVGLVNGLARWGTDGRFASFYDNEFNRQLDEVIKGAEDVLPNYYTDKEKNGKWYSPDYFMTGNFLWDGVVKNMGFAAGAYLTGGAYSAGLKGLAALPGASRLLSMGRAAEAVAASEEALVGLDVSSTAYQEIKGLNDAFLRKYNVLSKGHRAVVAGLSTSGEAGFEAYTNLNDFRNKKIQEYKDDHNGEGPVGADLEKINAAADAVGNASFAANVALLSATNYIQFPKILGSSYTAEKGIMNNVTREIGDITTDAAGKYIVEAPKNKVLSTLNKVRPYLFSTSEGFEEGAQYAAQMGTQDYYNKKYNGEPTSFLSAIGTGLREGFASDEGAKNILIGGLSGAIMMAKGRFVENRQQAKNTASATNQFNQYRLSDFTKETVDAVNRGVTLQEEREKLVKQGNITESKDRETDYIINYLTPRIKFGRFDLVRADINDQRTLASTDAGFEQLQNEGIALATDTKEAYLARLANFEETANNVKTMYQSLSLRYGGKVNADGTAMYPPSVIDKLIYAGTKIADYDKRIARVSEKLIGSVDNVDEILSDISEGNTESYEEALTKIQADNKLTDDQKEDLIQALDDSALMTIKRGMFVKEYNSIKSSPQNFQEKVIDDNQKFKEEEIEDGVPVIKVKTKDGERSLEVGIDYFVGKGVDYEKEELDTSIPISKLTIVGENEDGTVKIQTESGEVRDISKKVLENYKLGKVSSLKADKTANFFYNHRNDLYEFNFGKNFGGVKQGRLELQDGKLYFVYLNEEGKVDKKQLFNSHFVAQEGYDKARITKVGTVESETVEQQTATKEFTSPEEIAKQKETLAKNRNARLEILSQIEKETTERLEEVNKKLLSKVDELTKIQEDLDAIAKLKEEGVKGQKVKGNFSKVLSTSVRTLNRYANMKKNVDLEIAKLKAEQEELEMNISYFQDFANNLDDLPENTGEFLKELRDQIGWLTDLGKQTAESLSALEKLSKQITDAIKDTARLLKENLKKFDNEFSDYLIESIDNVIEAENPLDLLPALKQNLADYTSVNDLTKDISINEEKLQDASNQAKEIKAKLDELRNEYKAKKIIVDRFQKIFDEYKKQKAEEDKLYANEAIVNKALATADKGIQAREFSTAYEADSKKSNEIIPRATVTKEEGKPHQVRANKFGANLNSFPNRDDIRAVYVTAQTQNQLLPGVVERMLDNDPTLVNKYKDSMIIMVMVNTDGQLVGVDGQPIAAGTELLDAAIYQAFPEGKMRDGSLFRETTTQDVRDAIIAQYEAWRKEVLKEKTIGHKHEVEASFGIIDHVRDVDGKIKYSTRTSVTQSGLVSPSEIERSQLIFIPTTNTKVSKGTVSYDSPLGMVFLDMPNGYTKLQNRKHTQADASAIFDSMLQFAKNMINPEEGADSDSSKRILRFLQGVTYWGVPRNQDGTRKEKDGYSSVFFEKSEDTGRLMLMIGGKNTGILFTPSALRMNRDSIIAQIGNIYTNTNSALAKDLNEKFEQIISISPEGEITSELWDNYQSYLLSDVKPDGSKRKDYELPLSTTARPLLNNEDVNREGIYFYTTDTADDFVVPAPKKTVAKILTPGAPKPATTSNIETKKADIEKRRQKELFNSNNFIEIKEDKETLEKYINKDLYYRSIGEEGLIDALTNKILRQKGKDKQNNKYSSVYFGAGVKGFQEASSISDGTTFPIIAIVPKTNMLSAEMENTYKQQNVKTKKSVSTKNVNYFTIIENRPYLLNIALAEEINSKYNAELAALDALESSQQKAPSAEFAMEFTLGEETAPTYKLDGTTETYTSPEGKNILFRAPATTTIDNYNESITIIQGGDLAEIVEKIEAAGKDPKDIIKKTIYNAIAQDLTKLAAEQEMEFEFTMPDDVIEDAEKEVGKSLDQDVMDALNSMIDDGNDVAHRVAIESEVDVFEPENWNDVEKWLKDKFPNLPVYRVKNIIQATNGRQAWGMLKDSAIYLYQNAEVGTVYHEVFEAVWKMFTDVAEQEAIIKEFNSRKGTFIDRPTGKTIKYSEATAEQAKEQLAEEFRDYIMNGKIPAKPNEGRPFIVKLFADIAKFFKEFFLGKDASINTEELFKRIGSGYYKNNMPYATKLSMAKEGIIDIEDAFADSESEFRLAKISDKQGADIIQHMTYLTLTNLTRTDSSLFTRDSISSSELYSGLKKQILETLNQKNVSARKLLKNKEYLKDNKEEKTRIIKDVMVKNTAFIQDVSDEWPALVERHKEYLKGYQIEFDENDNVAVNDFEKSKDEGFGEASKIDTFKKANPAIKLLLSTIPVVNPNDTTKLKLSSIGGAILIPTSKTYISLMNNLHNAASIEEMLESLRVMAENDPNYRTLYERITKRTYNQEGIDLSKVTTTHGLQLISAFWKTFKKQNPDVKNVFILENGDVVVGDASLSNAANQLRSEYINNIVLNAKANKGFFTYDEKKKVFIGDQIKIKGVVLDSPTAQVNFLKELGIPFTAQEVVNLKGEQLKMFNDAVSGIRASISQTKEIATFSGKVLDISNRLLELGLVKATISNPEFNSTYFNVSGERTQSFIGTNAASDLYTFLSKIKNKQDIAGTKYSYLLSDSFAQGSNLMQRMFGSDNIRKKGTSDLFRIGYVSGTINESNGKQKPSSKLTFPERLIQELNLNLSGWYLNLIPGDASLEWMIKMGNAISTASISRGMTDINEIFKGYFLSELALSREEDRPVAKDRDRKELRFFKSILGKELHDDIIAQKGTVDEVYALNENKINAALLNYINVETSKYQAYLKRYGILQEGVTGFSLKNVNLPKNMSKAELNRQLSALTVNFMINNIEMHKLLYADPYQYDDELKRIKSFNSPRQSIVSDSPKMNAAFSNVWNKGYKKGDIGYTEFTQDYFKTATHEDIIGVIDLPGYSDYKETDGSGIIGMKSYRQFRIRAGEWNENEEKQFRYDVAWEKRDKDLKLSAEEKALLNGGNPQVKSAYTPLKPIVSGAKLGADGQPKNINDVVLDKYALYPLSHRIMKELNAESNAVKLYNKMQAEKIDYIVFKSARKVGAEAQHSTYNKKTGEFNNAPYEGIINVPFSIMSVQSEVPSKVEALVTRGSQVTKLITLDYLAAGVPIDFFPGKDFDQRYKAWNKLTLDQQLEKSPIFKEIKDNQILLNEIMEEGFNNLLNTLGIKLVDGEFKIDSLDKAVRTLRNEVLKREVNDNISDALTGFLNGKSVLEATPAGQQIKNILYSIADREVISPKISGGMKVQIPSSLLESVRAKESEINGKKGFTSDALKFYENKDGGRVCEIMVGRWFKSSKTDQELLDEWYDTDENGNKTLTEEGRKVLSGLAFRIPTQKQNSIDSFVIKQFLPEEFGDSVIVPAALVQKVGSDFDIDKLSIYFKNVYENKQGNIKAVPFLGYGEKAKAKFAEMFDQGEFINEDEMAKIEEVMLDDKKQLTRELTNKLMSSIFGSEYNIEKATLKDEEEELKDRQEFIENYLRDTTKEQFKSKLVNKLYKQSLENAYIQSSQNLVSHPSNFSKLIAPNSADELKALGNFIAEKTVGQSFDYKDVGNMLDRRFMARLRHAFVTGKYAIGIAAVNQTNHSLNQRQATYIDDTKLNKLSKEDRFWIGDAKIKFDKFNQMTIEGKGLVPTLSMITNADGKDISNILGQFIDGYVDISAGPWIMELGATPNVASTFMFLVKIGVPVDTVAYFMNQPIIYDYLNNIENAGYSWLFIEDFVKEIKNSEKYVVKDAEAKVGEINEIPSKNILKDNVGKQELNSLERVQQQFMLDEFLKYAKMAEQLFLVTQGSNYDTATLNDGLLIWKKDQQLAKAQNTIISSVDDLLDNSHIGSIRTKAGEIRKAFAQFLKGDQSRVRNVIQNVLTPYINMNDRDFLKIAQKVQNDLFDWAVQTNGEFNIYLQDALINDGGYAKEIMDFVNKIKENPKHPLFDNHVINIIEADSSKKASENTPNNIKVKGLDNKVYDQNNIIYAFRELKEYLKSQNELTGDNNQFYNNLVTLAVLQSGLSNSPISFTSVLPYEDFEKIYNKTLSNLENISNLDDFYNLGVFQKNNWSNDDIVPYKRAVWIESKDTGRKSYNPSMAFLSAPVKEAIANDEMPPVMTQSINSREAVSDFIVYTWEKREDLLTEEEMQDYKNAVAKAGYEGKLAPKLSDVINAKKTEMRKAGDYSFINKGLFQKVKDKYGTPLLTTQKSGDYFVYKAVNAWGDSFRANEFYATDHKSIFDNGFMQVKDVDNDVIITKFLEKPVRNTVEKKASVIEVYDKISDDSYSLSLQYGTGKYDMVITRDGEIIDPSFYNPSTNKDVDVDPSFFKFAKGDLEAIFKQLDESPVELNVRRANVESINTIRLKDGIYNKSDVNSTMLEKMGYTPEAIGKILKSIC